MANTYNVIIPKKDALYPLKDHIIFAGYINQNSYGTNQELIDGSNCVDCFNHTTGLLSDVTFDGNSPATLKQTMRFAIIMDCWLDDIDEDYALCGLSDSTTANTYTEGRGYEKYLDGKFNASTPQTVMQTSGFIDCQPNIYAQCQVVPGNPGYRIILGHQYNRYYYFHVANMLVSYSSSGSTVYTYHMQPCLFNRQNFRDLEFVTAGGGGATAVFRTDVSQLNNIVITPNYTNGREVPTSGYINFTASPSAGYQWESTPDYPVLTIGSTDYTTNDGTYSILYSDIETYGTPDQTGFYNLVFSGGTVEEIPAQVYNMTWMKDGESDGTWQVLFGETLPATLTEHGTYHHVFSYDPQWVIDSLWFVPRDYLVDEGITVTIDSSNWTCTVDIDVDTFIANYGRTVGGTFPIILYGYHKSAAPIEDDNLMFHVWLPTDENLEDINEAVFINFDTNEPEDVLPNFLSLKKFYHTFTANGTSIFVAGKYTYNSITVPYTLNNIEVVDVGTVELPEVYEDIRDYSPYCSAKIYLPMVGFVDIDINVIMGKEVKLLYYVSALTGQCLVNIIVIDGEDSYLYSTVQGDCSIDMPLRVEDGYQYKGSYDLIKANQLANMTPFILIETNETFGEYGQMGNFSSELVQVGSVDGFVKYKEIDVVGIEASKDELDEIKRWLINGVIVSQLNEEEENDG